MLILHCVLQQVVRFGFVQFVPILFNIEKILQLAYHQLPDAQTSKFASTAIKKNIMSF